jgi:hypothetical protein
VAGSELQAPGPADRQARAADGRGSTTSTRGGGRGRLAG